MPTDRIVLTACLHDLLQQQLHAVLATADEAGPYASLVAFAASPDLRQLVFATGRAAGGGFRIEARLPAMPSKTFEESVHEQ